MKKLLIILSLVLVKSSMAMGPGGELPSEVVTQLGHKSKQGGPVRPGRGPKKPKTRPVRRPKTPATVTITQADAEKALKRRFAIQMPKPSSELVATLDRELKKKVKNNKLVIRRKKNLEII